MNISVFDFIVVGCGLSGSVIARYLAEDMGKNVLIFEKRDHIGGNMYDYVDSHGILVHKYGPHTFHTNDKKLIDYVKRFSNWSDYYLHCMAKINGKYTPTPFNFKTIFDFYPPSEAVLLIEKLIHQFPSKNKVFVTDLIMNEEKAIADFGRFLYENDYKPYTAKQWGLPPEKLDISILKRVPINLSYEVDYFDDLYQAMPSSSYSDFFKSLLNHPRIELALGENALDHLQISSDNSQLIFEGKIIDKPVIYTGALDELFGTSEGSLPYRSLVFEWVFQDIESYQDAPVVAYPQEANFTRITEYKKLPLQHVSGTSYAIEFPIQYEPKANEPYYPVLTYESKLLHKKYVEKAKQIKNLFFCGRLADFKYYNMDQALARSLIMCERLRAIFSN